MKRCNYCEQVLSLDKYHKGPYPDGHSRRCKECEKSYYRSRTVRRRKEFKTWKVYYLPKEAYYGHTYHFELRMKKHRDVGRDTTGARILKEFKDKEDALFWEKLNQKKLKPMKQFKRYKVIRYGNMEAMVTTYREAAKIAQISPERCRQLIKNGRSTKAGYTFIRA